MNNIYFKTEFSERLFAFVPNNLIALYHIELYEETTGCLRVLNGEITALYMYIQTKDESNTVLKSGVRFNYKDNKISFNSLYVRSYKGEGFHNTNEYRLDENNKLIATYNFKSKDEEFFVVQNKESAGSKKYKNFSEPQSPTEEIKNFSTKHFTKEITDELFPAFYTHGNENEIYFLIQ